jgi:hypothetical protein
MRTEYEERMWKEVEERIRNHKPSRARSYFETLKSFTHPRDINYEEMDQIMGNYTNGDYLTNPETYSENPIDDPLFEEYVSRIKLVKLEEFDGCEYFSEVAEQLILKYDSEYLIPGIEFLNYLETNIWYFDLKYYLYELYQVNGEEPYFYLFGSIVKANDIGFGFPKVSRDSGGVQGRGRIDVRSCCSSLSYLNWGTGLEHKKATTEYVLLIKRA